MGDNTSTYTIVVDGKAGTLGDLLSAVKAQMRSDFAEIQSIANKVDIFKGLQTSAKSAADAFFAAQEKAAGLRQEIALIQATGGKVGDDLAKALKTAETAAASASKEYNKQSDAVAKLAVQLKAAGVNTNNLAAEELRLAAASKAASIAATDQAAKQALGLKTLSDVRPEIQRLNAAYNTLSVSGSLSVKELAIAQQALRDRVAEVRAQVTTLGGAAKSGTSDLVGFFQRSLIPALGLTAGLATVVAGIKESVAVAKEFNQGIAEIGTITNLSKDQLGALGAAARDLSRDLGLDVNAALKGIFDLIRSGVPPDNAIEVLRVAAEASKASLADLGTGVKAANLLIDSFGIDVKDLGPAFDKLIVGAHNGGATLKEFADSAGPLLNVARAANVPFDELVATLTVLVDKSGNAEESIAALTKIIAKIDTAAARAKLRDLNIEGTGLIDTFQKIAAKGLGLDQILDLGVASTKSAASIAALTRNAGDLGPALEKVRGSSGAAADALAKLLDTPNERAARFDAAIQEAKRNIGEFAGANSALLVTLTNLVNGFFATINVLNKVPDPIKIAEVSAGKFVLTLGTFVGRLLGLIPPAAAATTAVQTLGVATGDLTDKTDRLSAKVTKAGQDLADFAKRLADDIKAIQDASAGGITDIETRAAAQIAALDRGVKASAATAAATLAIESKLAADRLAIIVKEESDINAAVDKAAAARVETARKAGVSEKQIAADVAQARIAALAPVLAQYQDHYNKLLAQQQGFEAKVRDIEQQRIDFNRGIEKQIFDIRIAGLSVFDQYVAKVNEANRLISEARKAGVDGDIATAKKFTDEAITLAGDLKKVTDENQVVIITDLQAQTQKQELVKKAAEGYNEALDKQDDLAREGFKATQAGINEVLPKLKDLQDRFDALKKTIGEGLALKVKLDEDAVAAALATLDNLSKPRDVTVTVHTVTEGGTPVDIPQSNAAGGLIEPRRFARGGSVFRRPSWNKVPGSGDGDTVPAALPSGAFVIRKAASRYYGDGLMGAIAQKFASGGPVHYGAGSGGSLAQRILSGAGGGSLIKQPIIFNSDGSTSGVPEAQYADTLGKLRLILEAGQLLPKNTAKGGHFGVPVDEWAGTILQKWDIFQEDRRKKIDTAIQSDFDGIMSSISQGRAFHSEVNVAFDLAALALKRGGGRFRGSDTVPAWLTPGEWVINPRAVNNVGAGFLQALNSMKVPRFDLAQMLAPPQPIARFAAGGPVGPITRPTSTEGVTAGGTTSSGNTYVQNNQFTALDAASILSEANIRRHVLPVLDKVNKLQGK